MFLFVCPRNYRFKTEYLFIFLANLLFLILPFFLANLIFPARATAQTGTITGYVYKYSSTTTGISGVVVTAYDRMNNQKGFATTNSSGKYTITSLATGEQNDYYKVCAVKKDYVRECYQKPNTEGCTKTDCGFYWKEDELTDINHMLVDLYTKTSQSNINFYLMRGGSISGKIYGSNSNYAYRVVLEGNVQYKNRNPVPFEFYLNKTDNNNFYNDSDLLVIPPGSYKLRAEDASSALKYYSTVYYDGSSGTYNPQNARIFTYLLNQTTSNTAYFYIEKGGIIWGQVFEKFSGEVVGISDAGVTLTETSYPLPPISTKTEVVVDPNDQTVYQGAFYFSGLAPGSYILRTDDTPITDPNYRFYLPEYYDNQYFEEDANSIVITEESINVTNYKGYYVQVFLQHCPTIKGWVMDYSQKALEHITIEIIPISEPTHKELYKTTQTDPNGYIFKKMDKIIPGTYKIRAIDLNFLYFPTDYQTITVAAGKEYEVNFYMEKVPAGQGNGSLSGHFFLDENPDLPLSEIHVALISTINNQYKDTNTNENGEYLFNDIDPGEYILSTADKLPGGLIHELYKDVCILDPNSFEEGKNIINSLATLSTNILLLPGENRTNIDIGLSSYKYTFGKGLNLFGYPGLPVEKYDHTDEFCENTDEFGTKLGSEYVMKNFRGIDPVTGWYVITPSNLQSKKIYTGNGYMIYMQNKVGPIFYPPFKTIPPEFYHLKPGKNLIAYPSSLHRPIKSSSDLLTNFGTSAEVASVKFFDNTSGKWKSTVWLWNKPGAADFPIVQGGGYIVEMKVSKDVATDPPNYIEP